MAKKRGSIELRPDQNPARGQIIDGKPTMDEIVASNAFVHFEMMDDHLLWGRIDSGGKSVVIWIRANKGRLIFTAEFD